MAGTHDGAGEKIHRMEYQEDQGAVADADTLGQVPDAWKTIGYAWASRKAMSGREIFRAAQTQAEATHLITINLPEFNVKSKGRWLEGTRTFYIAEPPREINEQGRFELEMLCHERESET